MASIIIIEDDELLGPLLKISLEEGGHYTQWFTEANEGLAAYELEPARIVIADLILKKGDKVTSGGGLSFIWETRKRAKAKNRALNAIAISGTVHRQGMQDMLKVAQSIGADAVLEKPFEPQQLLNTVDQLLTGQTH